MKNKNNEWRFYRSCRRVVTRLKSFNKVRKEAFRSPLLPFLIPSSPVKGNTFIEYNKETNVTFLRNRRAFRWKLSTLFQEIVDTFAGNCRAFYKKLTTYFLETVDPFAINCRAFHKKPSTLLRETDVTSIPSSENRDRNLIMRLSCMLSSRLSRESPVSFLTVAKQHDRTAELFG